jgi:hypothetical protein
MLPLIPDPPCWVENRAGLKIGMLPEARYERHSKFKLA